MKHGHYYRRFRQLWGTYSGTVTEFFDRISGTRDHNNVRGLLWNAEYASEVDKKKRRGTLTKGVVLLHDNTRPPHRGSGKCFTQALQLGDFRSPLTIRTWRQATIISSPRWRSGWLPSASIPTKSSWMKSTTGCVTWLHRFFEEGLQKLVSRYDKCLNVDGNYVEK